jgi:hypothetical protein
MPTLPRRMPAPPPPPLTHHQILGLVAPFTRSGRAVDLPSSDRLARTLRFQPRSIAAVDGLDAEVAGRIGALTETLQLECHASGSHRLTRTLAPAAGGPAATLQAVGPDPAALLALIDAVPPARQFDAGPGWCLARSHELLPPERGGAPVLTFSRGEAQLDGLLLRLQVMHVKNVAGDITLQPAPGAPLALPEDVLAVIGWNWARLLPETHGASTGWTSKLRLRGRGPVRTARAEQALGQAARHLAQVLAMPPAQYHRRWLAARWGVVLRRSIPSLTALGLIAGAVLLPRHTDEGLRGMWMVLHYVPIALLALSFTLQELARFEIPPLPRRLRQAGWRRADAPAQGNPPARPAGAVPTPATPGSPAGHR